MSKTSGGVLLIEEIRSHLGHGSLGSATRAKSVAGWVKAHRANRRKVSYWGDAFALWGTVVSDGIQYAAWRTGSGRTAFFVSDEVAHIIVTTGSALGRKPVGRIVGYAQMRLTPEGWVSNLWLGNEPGAKMAQWLGTFFSIIQIGKISVSEGQFKTLQKIAQAERKAANWWLSQPWAIGEVELRLRTPLVGAWKKLAIEGVEMEEVKPPRHLLALYSKSRAENARSFE